MGYHQGPRHRAHYGGYPQGDHPGYPPEDSQHYAAARAPQWDPPPRHGADTERLHGLEASVSQIQQAVDALVRRSDPPAAAPPAPAVDISPAPAAAAMEAAQEGMQQQMAKMQQSMEEQAAEVVALRQALVEESRRRMLQEEALRSLWQEVQHLQSWAEQVSSAEQSFMRSPSFSAHNQVPLRSPSFSAHDSPFGGKGDARRPMGSPLIPEAIGDIIGEVYDQNRALSNNVQTASKSSRAYSRTTIGSNDESVRYM